MDAIYEKAMAEYNLNRAKWRDNEEKELKKAVDCVKSEWERSIATAGPNSDFRVYDGVPMRLKDSLVGYFLKERWSFGMWEVHDDGDTRTYASLTKLL